MLGVGRLEPHGRGQHLKDIFQEKEYRPRLRAFPRINRFVAEASFETDDGGYDVGEAVNTSKDGATLVRLLEAADQTAKYVPPEYIFTVCPRSLDPFYISTY